MYIERRSDFVTLCRDDEITWSDLRPSGWAGVDDIANEQTTLFWQSHVTTHTHCRMGGSAYNAELCGKCCTGPIARRGMIKLKADEQLPEQFGQRLRLIVRQRRKDAPASDTM